ncbi:MAG: BACON domain-containing protein [Bacteroidales bacterium]|nr:BACON domain-containing protein [Bacteroidales bacterium]
MKRLFAILLCAGALAACTKTQPEASKLDVGATEILTPSKATVAQFTIATDAAWKAEVSEKWVVASKLSGTGNDVVKLAVMANTDYSSREATITVKAGSLEKTVKLIQAQMDGIIVDQDKVTVPYGGGVFDFPVKANIVIEAESDVDWMSFETTKALSEETFTVSIELNAGRESRTGHITITGEDLEQEITVVQGAFEPEFDLVDELGVGLWGTLPAPKEGLTYTFTAATNMEFEADAPDADWIHITTEDNVITVTIDENPGAARAEYIYMGCYVGDEDYSDYGAMITVKQKGQAQAVELWKMDFYWDIFPQGTRVSTAVAGDYFVLYSPGAITAGYHLMNKADGTEASVLAPPVENVTGVTNDEAGNVIVTTGGDFPIDNTTWALIPEQQIPLKVYVMSQEDFLSGNYGDPIITYNDGFYGYGLDNAQVNGNAKGNGLLSMTSGAAGGGTASLAWEIKDGSTTNAPTVSATSPTAGGDMWDSFHCVTIGAGVDASSGFYFAGYVGDYNLHFSQKLGAEADWSVVFTTGYTWEGAVNTGDVFTYEGHRYLAILGMDYFSFADWDYDGVVDGYRPGKIWVFNIDDPAKPELKINQEYMPTEGNWQYGSNTDIEVVEEDGTLVAYVVDVATSTYRKFELEL